MTDDITRSIAHAANRMQEAGSVEDTLEVIVRSAAETLPAFDHIGVSTVDKGGAITTRAATSELVLELDRLQYHLPEGPCVDSLRGDEVVVAPDIRHDQRWPGYVPRALPHGLRSQLAVRLHLAGRGTIGGLNLYSTTREKIADHDVEAAAFFATHASVALSNAHELATLGDAVASRQLIGQAIGILMERYHIDEQAAQAFLWRASSHGNTKVREIAARLVQETSQQQA